MYSIDTVQLHPLFIYGLFIYLYMVLITDELNIARAR